VGAGARQSLNPHENQSARIDGAAVQHGAQVGAGARQSSNPRDNQSARIHGAAVQHGAHVGVGRRGSSGSRVAGRELTSSSSQTNEPVGAGAGQSPGARLPRAKQTIPPALRRAVLLRDRHCCQVPGCSNARWVDVHHIALRSEGGRHSLQNLVCVCAAHHRAVHDGQLRLERSESGAICVQHADGTEYGGSVVPARLELRAKVFSALRHLGFREAQARAALEQLQREPPGMQASFDGLLRAALARLRSPGARR